MRKTMWVCSTCGKGRDRRDKFRDVSCYMHSVEVYEDSVKLGEDGLIKSATAVEEVSND